MQVCLKKIKTSNIHVKLIVKKKLKITAMRKMNSFALNVNLSILAITKIYFNLMLTKWENQFKLFKKI